jgi:hypothetical protein
MPVVNVTTVTATGAKRAICSCGWEGPDRAAPKDAWQDKARHEREHRETAS